MSGGGGLSRFSVEFFLSQSAENFRRGFLLCFTEFLVSKKFLEKRWEYPEFPSKFFCLTLPGIFVGEPISVSLFSGNYHFYASEGYVTAFCRKYFVSQCRKTSKGISSVRCSRKNLVSKNFMEKRDGVGYHDFPSKIFVSHFRTIS